ncbi:hypothetical protein VHEMI09130 [[Torrubiella] hemipterigena]|uniref:Glycosyl transferase n=1 Tax=[Torrubiella] hemipterigena TaxID=1531966 RepID=A0A0A1TPG8_9HYPO|nr:hypothetical protein VHEMI09130 [[Torrubiella] hemipterigena]
MPISLPQYIFSVGWGYQASKSTMNGNLWPLRRLSQNRVFSKTHPLITVLLATILIFGTFHYMYMVDRTSSDYEYAVVRTGKAFGTHNDQVHDQDRVLSQREEIPNIAHFTYILKDPSADFNFQFKHYLSIYSAWHFDRPHTIYLTTNANNESVARAVDGRAGKWNNRIFNIPGLRINHVKIPTKAKNGVGITGMEHKSDFARVQAMNRLGGVYRDFDVHTLRSLSPLLQSGFKAVVGRAQDDIINSGIFLSTAGGTFISTWEHDMHEAFDGSWSRHSDAVITRLSNRLVREPLEVLIMDRVAFAPGGWFAEAYITLFGTHNTTESNLARFKPGDTLPSFEEKLADRWQHPEKFPDWAIDYSSTYLLHAFAPDRSGFKIEGFDTITPRYVLERQSNFARAVYPIAKIMYDRGLIDINDSHEG